MLLITLNRKHWLKIGWAASTGVLCLILVSSGWAAGRDVRRAQRKAVPLPPVDISKLVWPLPPQTVRLRFVSQVSGEADLLGIKHKKGGWLEKAAGVTVQDDERPRLRKPYGVAVDSKGLIYVADSAQNKVFVFDLEKKLLTYRGDQAPAQMELPIGVALDDKDRLFVSDAKLHRITCFDAKGSVLAVFGEDKLVRPAGLAVDNELRRLYVADAKGERIAIFDLDTLKFTRAIEKSAPTSQEPLGTLGEPTNLAVDPDGLVYVVNTLGNRIEEFDTDGNFVRGFGQQGRTPGKFSRPKGIAIDSDGHVYVADNEFNNIQIFTQEGRPLLVAGNFGPQPGQFTLLSGLAFDKQNRLVATDSGLGRVEVFRYVTDKEALAAEGNTGKAEAETKKNSE